MFECVEVANQTSGAAYCQNAFMQVMLLSERLEVHGKTITKVIKEKKMKLVRINHTEKSDNYNNDD